MRNTTARWICLVLMLALLPVSAACNIRIGDDSVVGEVGANLETPEGARDKIAEWNIPYTVDEFVKRARESDAVAVQLFLTAGMNPDAKNKDGITALEAATDAGHMEIVKLLKEPGKKEDK